MRVFVAGGSGAMGRRLMPRLVTRGHEVVTMRRATSDAAWLEELGVPVAVAVALERDSVMQAVVCAEPEAVVHQLTGLAGVKRFRRFDREFALTGNQGHRPALRQLLRPRERALRTWEIAGQVRKRRFPVVGDGGGIWSFVHIDDAAAATIAALERGDSGIYNVVDDEPALVAEWLPELARVLGAKPPRRVPVWLGRIAAGEVGISMMTQIRGTSNAKAKRKLGWQPAYPSYREGFRTGLGALPVPGTLVRARP